MRERRLRILTANLLNGRADARALAATLHALEVDVAAFQELGPEQAAAAAEVLPHGKLEPARDHNGMGIALRRPAEVQRLPLRDRDARLVALEAEEWGAHAPLEILNLHLQAPHSIWPWNALAQRRAQVAGITSYLRRATTRRRVLVGDLNATPLWPAYRRLVDHLPDAVADHARRRRQRPHRTWGPWPGAPRLLRIDHVLAAGVRVAHVERVEIRGSDHSALLVEIGADEPPERDRGSDGED